MKKHKPLLSLTRNKYTQINFEQALGHRFKLYKEYRSPYSQYKTLEFLMREGDKTFSEHETRVIIEVLTGTYSLRPPAYKKIGF